ncbi:MAG: hypothetical protein LBJ42_01080, partial [Holosporales bacterium]|nr:hypothetical protein [Holosporales bacterium]
MKRRAALVMLTAMTFVANLQWVHAAGGTMAYRMAEPKTQKGAASHGVVLELVDRGTLTPEERKQMLRTPDGVESGRQPTVWETAPNGEKLPAKCNRYDELSAGELALWRLIQLADGRHRLMARRVRGEPHIPNIEPQGHFGELVGDIIRVLESAHTEVAKQGNRINPALLDNVQRVVMQAAIIYYASAHSKGEIVGILTGNHIRALNRYCKMVERWGLDAIGMWGDVTDHPLERLSEYLDVPRWNGGTLRVPVPAAALMLISRSEDVMKKLSIEERTKITLNARLWDSDVGLGESDIAILCRNCRRALEMIRKLKYQ